MLSKPKLRSDVINDKDILLLTIKGLEGPINLLNVYSDTNGHTISLLCNVSLPPLSYVGGNFNCPSMLWDPLVRHSSLHSKTLHVTMSDNGLGYKHVFLRMELIFLTLDLALVPSSI